MTGLDVAPATPSARAVVRATVAALPESYSLSGSSTPAVVMVAGEPGWPRRAVDAVHAGARAVVLIDPPPVPPNDAELLALAADRAGVVVELAERFAGDPALTVHARDLRTHLSAAGAILLTERAPTLARASATLDVLRTLRALGRPGTIASLWQTSGAVLLHGTAGGRPLEACIARSSVRPRQRIQAVGVHQTLDIALHGGPTAAPAEISVAIDVGALQLPTVYETPARAALRRVRAALDGGGGENAVLWSFVEDVAATEPHFVV